MPEGVGDWKKEAGNWDEGDWDKLKNKLDTNPAFHLAEVVDPVQALIDRVGWDRAFDQIKENLDSNPSDSEARRQANLIVTLLEKRTAEFKSKLNH